MPDRFAFPPRRSADAIAEALAALPDVTLLGVAPRYLPEGPRWVVEVRCATRESFDAAFRLHRVRSREWPPNAVVLTVEAGRPRDPRGGE